MKETLHLFITMMEAIPPSTSTLGFLRQEAHRINAICE